MFSKLGLAGQPITRFKEPGLDGGQEVFVDLTVRGTLVTAERVTSFALSSRVGDPDRRAATSAACPIFMNAPPARLVAFSAGMEKPGLSNSLDLPLS